MTFIPVQRLIIVSRSQNHQELQLRMQTLTVEVTHPLLNPDSAILRLKGGLNPNLLQPFDHAVQSALAGSKKNLVIDLSETDEVSSGGWGFLLVVLGRVRILGGTMLLAAMKPDIHEAFELMEYHQDFILYPTVEDALKAGMTQVS